MCFHYPELSVMAKLAVEPQNRTNMLRWLCPGKNNYWMSVWTGSLRRSSSVGLLGKAFGEAAVKSNRLYLCRPASLSSTLSQARLCRRLFHTPPFPCLNIPDQTKKYLSDHQQIVALNGFLMLLTNSSLVDLH